MDHLIETLALSRYLNDICVDNDIDPTVIIRWLLSEELINLTDYFQDLEGEST